MAERFRQLGRHDCVRTVARGRRLLSAVLPLGLLIALSLGGPSAWAREWYRYKNDQGVVEINQTIPPHIVDRGYTVLDDAGRVVRVVPSRADREVQDARRKLERAAREQREARAASDQELMRMYSSGEDVDRARDRRLDSIRAAMAITQSNLRRLTAQKAAIEEQGRNAERAGNPVPTELVNNLKVIEGQIRDRKIELAARRAEHDKVKRAYDANAQRVRELYGQAAPAGG